MKVVITGGKGFVGTYLSEKLKEENEVISAGKDLIDVTNFEQSYKVIKRIKPDTIVHCAAFSNVDECEINKRKAILVNAIGTENIAKICRDMKCKMVYISTDFVFDGNKRSPYSEIDPTQPVNHYGKTKLLGEYYTSYLLNNFIIVRTSRIFGKNGKNFASKLPFLLTSLKEIKLTTDIVNSPTYVVDLVNAIDFLIKKDYSGIVNVCNQGECSWYEFGKEILKNLKLKNVSIKPVKFSEIDVKAQRPSYSTLNTQLLQTMGFCPPEWKQAVKNFLNSIF